MSLSELLSDTRPIGVSFEFSPPKTVEAEENLWKAIRRLEPLAPSFVSVTYGAGGSTRERTHATVKRIVDETTLKPAAHLTCVGHTRREIEEIVRGYWDCGIRHIVALRGDMPEMSGPYRPHELGYASTPELIEGVRSIAPFEISVSFYPEKHPELADTRARCRSAQEKGRCRRDARARTILLRHRRCDAFSRQGRERRHRRPDHSRHHADDGVSRRGAHGRQMRHEDSGLADARLCRS